MRSLKVFDVDSKSSHNDSKIPNNGKRKPEKMKSPEDILNQISDNVHKQLIIDLKANVKTAQEFWDFSHLEINTVRGMEGKRSILRDGTLGEITPPRVRAKDRR
jgi:hypothetical protein